MCNRLFLLAISVVVLATTGVINTPAVAQYAPTVNPAAHAKMKKAEEMAKIAVQKAEEAEATAAAAVTEGVAAKAAANQLAVEFRAELAKKSAPPPKKEEGGWMWWVFVGVVGVVVVVVVFLYRRFKARRFKAQREDHTIAPPPAEPDDIDHEDGNKNSGKGDVHHAIIAVVLALGFVRSASAGCYVAQVGALKGDAHEATMVVGQKNFVHCTTNALALTLSNDSRKIAIPNVVFTKATEGYDFTFTPTTAGEFRVMAGNVTVARLFAEDGAQAWSSHVAIQQAREDIGEVRAEVSAAKAAAVDTFTKVFGPDGKSGLSAQVAIHESRIAALEGRSDDSALKAEIKRLQNLADKANKNAEVAMNELQKVMGARVRTGVFRSKTIGELVQQ